MTKNNEFISSACTKAALVALVACAASPAAMAAVQCRTTPIALISTTDVYINLVTGAASGSAPAGWDINPYPSTTGFAVYWGGGSSVNGGVADTTTGPFTVLSSGAVIGPSSTFAVTSTGSAGMYPFYVTAGQTNKYLGVKFANETLPGNPINYGWVSLTTTGAAASGAGAGYPATINGWCWQDDGTAITAGTTPVSLQSYSID